MRARHSPVAELAAFIPRIARNGLGNSGAEQELAQALRRHGASPLPVLLPYLEHPQRGVGTFTAYVLRDGPTVDPSDLPVLIRAMKRGNYEVAYAIARIGTPQAIRSLTEQLRRGGDYQGPLSSALTKLGIKAVPYLSDLIRTASPMPASLPRTIAEIFSYFKPAVKQAAVQPLLGLVRDTHLAVPNRATAVYALESLGPF